MTAAGNYADSFRKAIGVGTRVEPWSGFVGYRGMFAHQLPEDLNHDRVWEDVRGASQALVDVNTAAPR